MHTDTLRETVLSTALLPNQAALFYLGQEGFLIKYNDRYLLIDGYLTDYVDRNFATEQVPWKRLYDSPLDPSSLDFVDYVFCTHPHGDHADPDTLRAIHAVNQKAHFYAPHALQKDLVSFGIPASMIHPMDGDETVTLPGSAIKVTAIPSAHEVLHKEDGHFDALGYIIALGDIRLYHAGDCCIYDGLTERLTAARIDIGLLPINGRDYFRGANDIVGNMDSAEALMLAKLAGIDLLIPMHYDLYAVNAVNPAHFVDVLQTINPAQKSKLFVPGERLIYAK